MAQVNHRDKSCLSRSLRLRHVDPSVSLVIHSQRPDKNMNAWKETGISGSNFDLASQKIKWPKSLVFQKQTEQRLILVWSLFSSTQEHFDIWKLQRKITTHKDYNALNIQQKVLMRIPVFVRETQPEFLFLSQTQSNLETDTSLENGKNAI